ncbi:hypothetical protein D9M68_913600 [compost metagenome]
MACSALENVWPSRRLSSSFCNTVRTGALDSFSASVSTASTMLTPELSSDNSSWLNSNNGKSARAREPAPNPLSREMDTTALPSACTCRRTSSTVSASTTLTAIDMSACRNFTR